MRYFDAFSACRFHKVTRNHVVTSCISPDLSFFFSLVATEKLQTAVPWGYIAIRGFPEVADDYYLIERHERESPSMII